MAAKQLSSVECICIEKRGFIPNRYYVYVLIVGWSDGEKHPIYRKYSSFYDFEKTLRDRIGNSSAIPELPTMNVLEKAFKIEKNHLNEISEFCMGILRLPQEIVNSHVISAFFEVWISDFPMEDSSEDNKAWAKKKDPKKRPQPETADHTSHTDKIAASAPNIETIPSAPYEEIIHSSPELVAESADEDIQVQEYVCTADYAPDSSSELSLTQGMKCVVLERNDDGWWFIMRESDGRQGYAPGSFLVPALPRKSHVESLYSEIPPLLNNNNNIKETGKWDPLMTARALCSYEASNEDEISYTKGEELQVLGTDNSGWWTVRCHAKVGLVPAVHLELTSPSSARRSTAFMKNNSLYSRKPPPRRQHSSVKDVDTDSVKKLVEPDSPTDSTPHIQAEYATVPDDMASKRFLVPSNKSQSAGLINYAELVFDDTDKQRVVKSSSNGGLVKPIPKKIASSSIIYTQIMPKNVRKAEEHSTPTTEASGLAGKKPERCKAVKKVPASKVDEVESRRKTPSPPASPPTISLGRESPVPIKPRTVRPDPTRTYENHTVPPPACNGDTKAEGHMYINIASGTSQGTSDTDTEHIKHSMLTYRRDRK